MKKRRHHHVWKAYLRAWATQDRIAVLQDTRMRVAHIDDVAVQRDFYKLQAITAAEMAFIRKFWIEKSPEVSRKMHEHTLFMLTALPTLHAAMSDNDLATQPDLARELDEKIHNIEEDYHAHLENRAAPLIEAARKGDIDFYTDDKHAIEISHFLALQHFRTATMRKRMVERLHTRLDLDISRCWNVLAHIFAANVGFSLFMDRKRRPLALLENKTDVPFITSDQPTVNLLGTGDPEKSPDHLALYYPISPRFALLLDDADNPCRLAESPITEPIVRRLNAAEARAAERQLFADAVDAFAPYVRVPA